VTRGPGSISDGYNAYAGSIHIITYGERTIDNGLSSGRIIAKAGSYNYRMGGFTKAYQVGDLSIFTDFFYQRDDKHLPAGPDALATGIFGPDNISLAKEGEAPLWMRNYALGLQFDYKVVTFHFRTTYNERGSAYGLNGALPNEDDYAKFPVSYAEFSYHPKIGECQTFIKAGIKESAFKSSSMLLPSGFQLDGVHFPDGFYGEHVAKLRKVYQTSYAKYTGIEHHTLNIGYYIDSTKTYDVVTKTTDRDTGVGIIDYSESYPFIDPNANQRTYRLFLQDRYQYNKALSFQFGVNIERVSNISTQINPRFSIVYQKDRQNIYKAIYSRSSRSPSWQELFSLNNRARVGNPDLNPEVVHAFELAYIRKWSVDAFFQVNAFYLQNSD